MYSKEQAKQLKKDFWVAFAAAYPRKWLLYNTKIKDVALKFYIDNKKAEVIFEISNKDEKLQKIYFQKIESLQTILREDHLPDVIIEENFYNEDGQRFGKVWVEIDNVSCNKKETWPQIFEFFNEKMSAFEYFFLENENYIRDLNVNT